MEKLLEYMEKKVESQGEGTPQPPRKYISKSGGEAYFIPKNLLTMKIKELEEKPLNIKGSKSTSCLCSSCYRDMFSFNNMPCTVPCGHTFCEMCLAEESEIYCKGCQKSFRTSSNYVPNKALISLHSKFSATYGNETEADVYWREIKFNLRRKVSEIEALLPVWERSSFSGIRLIMTLQFWKDEINKANQRFKTTKFPPVMAEDLSMFSEVVKILGTKVTNGYLNYCDTKWREIMQIHKGFDIPDKFSSPAGIRFCNCLEHICPIYVTEIIEGLRWFFRISTGFRYIYIHSGVTDISEETDSRKEYKIFEASKLIEATKIFLDLCIRNDGNIPDLPKDVKEIRKRVIIQIQMNKTDFQERWWHMFVGTRGKSIMDGSVKKTKDFVFISEADSSPYVFEVPSSEALQKEKLCSSEEFKFGSVVGYREAGQAKLMIMCRNSINKMKPPYFFGDIKTGMDFLLHINSSVVIEGCGLCVMDGQL